MKIKLIVLLSWTLVVFLDWHRRAITIPGFSSYENCAIAGKGLEVSSYKCVEVK